MKPGNKLLSFENALFQALKNNGMLLPTTDEQAKQFEESMGNTESPPQIFDLTGSSNDAPKGNIKTLGTSLDELNPYMLKVATIKKKKGSSDESKPKA